MASLPAFRPSRCFTFDGGALAEISPQRSSGVMLACTGLSSAAPRGPRGREDLGDLDNAPSRCSRHGSRRWCRIPQCRTMSCGRRRPPRETTPPRRGGSRTVPRGARGRPPDTRCPPRTSAWHRMSRRRGHTSRRRPGQTSNCNTRASCRRCRPRRHHACTAAAACG